MRENGGQYTHGAIWLAMALLRSGDTERGAQMLGALAPGGAKGYTAEPFYIAADVYSRPGLYGRAGWSIYTGAAGWYLRAVTGELLGLRFLPGRLELSPRIPPTWQGFSAQITVGEALLELEVKRGGAPGLTLDGESAEFIPLPLEKGSHRAILIIE